MNIQTDDANETTWVGVASVLPKVGSFQEKRGLIGGYGFVTFRNQSLLKGIAHLSKELLKGGTELVGFEWLCRLQDNERQLLDSDFELIEKLDSYPVQFCDIHWFRES